MLLRHLWLSGFRNYADASLELAPTLTAILGDNGQGKTNLLEAVGYLASLSSFRGAPGDALVRAGDDRAVIRAEGERDGRELLIEAELVANGRNRIQVNRQKLARSKDLLGAIRVSVFAPDDLQMVKGGPGTRRTYLDDALVALHPRNHSLRTELDRVLRQRNALLRQSGGRLDEAAEVTLEVWDAKLVEVGEALAAARTDLVTSLAEPLRERYQRLAGRDTPIEATYTSAWHDRGLADALADARRDELRRGVTLVGPHRDDLSLFIGGLPARSHASQGEQRSMALALRLAAHYVVTEAVGSAPVLLLDDVFSELDPARAAALVETLPEGQSVLTSATGLPTGVKAERTVHVRDGRLEAP
ncbi:MAG: DNA replication/repair protein RecF [Actinomycetota bacterium]|nr:DNA replication/repair protein RecF [Actinomycetota bacterium]